MRSNKVMLSGQPRPHLLASTSRRNKRKYCKVATRIIVDYQDRWFTV